MPDFGREPCASCAHGKTKVRDLRDYLAARLRCDSCTKGEKTHVKEVGR